MANLGTGIAGAASGAAGGAAIGGPVGGIIGGAAGLIGGLFGGSDHSEEIEKLQREAASLFDRFGPVDLSDPIVFQQFQQAGLLSPQMEQALSLQMEQKLELQERPEDRAQQAQTINALKQLSQTGLSPEDLAAFNKLRSQVGADTEAKRNQILQQAQMRGQAGGGAQLASELMASQAGSQQASEQADRLAAEASSARRQALNNLFSGQSQLRGQDIGVAQANMQNEALRRQFLDQNALARQQRNVGAQNQANLFNVSRQQGVADQNTSMANAELLRQKNAKRQYWADQLTQAQNKAYALTGQAGNLRVQDQASAQGLQNIFSGVGQLGSTINSINGGPLFGGKTASTSGGGSGAGGAGMINMASGGIVTPSPSPSKHQEDIKKFEKGFNSGEDFGESFRHLKETIFGHAGGGKVDHDNSFPGAVPTDSEKNDNVPAMLSPGEIVIPKSFAHDKDLAKAYIDYLHKLKNSEE